MNGTKKNITKKKIYALLAAFFILCLITLFVFGVGKELQRKDNDVFAAEEAVRTYEFTSLEDFLAYSEAYAAGSRNRNDTLVFSLNQGSAITDGRFISLGTSDRPFAGVLNISTIGMNTFFLYNCPLFDYVSTDMTVTGSGIIRIERYAAYQNPNSGVLTSGALFANHVVLGNNASADWEVVLSPCTLNNPDAEKPDIAATSYEGLIGDIADGCDVTIDFTDTTSYAVTGTSSTGYICGSLGEGASLAVTTGGSGSNRTLSTSSGHAGGLVGEMKAGSSLQFDSANNTRVSSVTTTGGYAGGIVGYADNVTITYGNGISPYVVSGTVSGSTGAGGLFGYYKNETAGTFDVTDYSITSGLTVTGSGPSGGVFGSLVNTASSFTFDGNSSSLSVTLSGGSSCGGVCGRLQTSALTDTIAMTNVIATVNTTSNASQSAGLIGGISDNPAYITASGITITATGTGLHGGLIGSMGSGGSFLDLSGSVTVSGTCAAGIVYNIPHGVLRLQGTTNLSGFVKKDNGSGTIVRSRSRALVYAVGDGAGTNDKWELRRNTTSENLIEDIESWGQVIRADGVILTESDLFTVDGTAHTVTVKQAYTTMNNITQFALTALNIKLNTGAGVGALQFTSGSANRSATLLAGTLALGADIDLTGTGLYGLTRDDGGNAAFSGTFDGNGHAITFATGKPYGLNSSGAALSSSTNQGKVYRHKYIGLFAKTNNATVEDLTLDGDVIIYQNLDNDNNNKNNVTKAGALTAQATNGLTLTDLNVPDTFILTYRINNDINFLYFGGAVGCAVDGANISVTHTTNTPVIKPRVNDLTTATGNNKTSYFGGVIGGLLLDSQISPVQTVAFSGAKIGLNYNKTGNGSKKSTFGGAIAFVEHCSYVKGNRNISFASNTALDITANGTLGASSFGGILGYEWLATDVSITSLTIDADMTASSGVANYGGLVMTATGGWSISGLNVHSADYHLTLSNNNSTFGFVANKTYKESTRTINSSVHNLASALYLTVDNTGDNYNIGALSFSFSGGYSTFAVFDEIVADSRYNGGNITNNGNSVISVATSDNTIATSDSYNTYLNKTTYGRTASGKINAQTRYYYNIDYARGQAATVDKYNFLIWSVKQYAHSSLSAWFVCTSSFTGTLDMTGLSYYPVDLQSSSVTFSSATLTLDNNLMESRVKYAYYYNGGADYADDRSTRDNDNQHYLMHTSVFRNVLGGITISGLTMQGNVPRFSDSSCGFFISGTLGGSNDDNTRMTATNLTFNGTKIVTSAGADLTTDVYAPLFINKIAKNTTLNIAGAVQSGYSGSTVAASSLIGDVGDNTASVINLTFTGFAFDSRSSTGIVNTMTTRFGTSKTIFSRATILNSFIYFNESSGSYNFGIAEDWNTSTGTQIHNVTYGKEITSSLERSNQQKKYHSSTYYTHPTTYQAASEYDFSTNFLPYVYVAYDAGQYKHELSVNVSFASTIEGCGKYGDPYIIDDNEKLAIIARIIAGDNVGSTVHIYLPDDLTDFSGMGVEHTDYEKDVYKFGTSTFNLLDDTTGPTNANVRTYLAGAYYIITRDITLAYDYVGLGSGTSDQYAFRGVIIGQDHTITNNSPVPLIHTSIGSVVKDVTVNVSVYDNGSNEIELAAPSGSDVFSYTAGTQAYGAVIGRILGGDNFIDAVDVDFSSVTFSLTEASNHYQRLIPIGGYVGALVNGGLIFRNMTASNVGLTSTVFDKVADSGYLYVNPIIGRVIAGYAFHETNAYHSTEATTTLKNSDKNYTICDLLLSDGKLTVAYDNDNYTVTIPNGQAIYVLGAIVNSGASSASRNGNTEQAYDLMTGTFWSAYRTNTAVRGGATYEDVGDPDFASRADYLVKAANDDCVSTGLIPYIIRAYTANASGSLYLARYLSSTSNVYLNVTGNYCDVAQGFRGIGSIFYDSNSVRLRITGMNGNGHSINLNMRYLEYDQSTVSTYIAASSSTAGFGLFNILHMSTRSAPTGNNPDYTNTIQNFVLSGSVFYDIYTAAGTQVTYLFSKYSADNNVFDDVTKMNNRTVDNYVNRPTCLSVGGIGGFSNMAYHIHNVVFNGLSVEGAKTAGGLIGLYMYKPGDISSNTAASRISYITYGTNSLTVGEVNVTGGLQAGGLIGCIFGKETDILGATGGTTIKIGTIKMKSTVPNQNNPDCLNYYANVTIGAGGVVGCAWASYNKVTGSVSHSLDGFTQTNTFELIIKNITLTKGTSTANIYVEHNSTTANQENFAGGFIGSAHDIFCIVENCALNEVNVTANTAGGIIGKITQKYFFQVKNFSMNGNSNAATITGTHSAGGIAGWVIGRDTFYFTFDSITVTNYNIVSVKTNNTIGAAGGLIGYLTGDNVDVGHDNNYICRINNIIVNGCDMETRYTKASNASGTGGLIGSIARGENDSRKFKLSGYNILISDITLTHKEGGTATEYNVSSSSNPYIGDIVGNNFGSTTIKFVGVSVKNDVYCGRHVGKTVNTETYGSDSYYGTSGGYIVFADFNDRRANTTFAGVADGTTNSDDYTNVTSADPYVTAAGTITVGGIKLTGDGVASTTNDLPIQSILTDVSNLYQYSATGNLATFSTYAGKLAMFSTEVTGYTGTDFPVLILEDTNKDNSHAMINSYLRLLTNTTFDFGKDDNAGSNQTYRLYDVKIYNMVYNAGNFSAKYDGTASLKRTGDKFYMLNTVFDSGKVQFSLIDIRFYDPWTSNTASKKVAYHVYVPVFVKKVLSYSFDIAVQSGTNYLASAYSSIYGRALIENIGTPVTTYFQYTYTRTASEWAEAINGGESVNRNYAKKLLMNKANDSNALSNFPSGTVLVLVDPNNGGKVYYATVGAALDGNNLNLSAFRSSMTMQNGVLTFSGDTFSPVLLQDMLGLTVDTVGDGTDTLIQCALNDDPTVIIDGVGYRLPTEEEEAEAAALPEQQRPTKYTVSVGTASLVEKYYLSVFTESSAENDLLFHYYILTTPTAFAETDYPSKITDTGAHTLVHLVMGKIFSHSNLTVTSSSESIGPMTDDNNELTVEMTVDIGLSEDLPSDIKSNLQTMIHSTNVYQGFLVYLNRKEGSVISRAIIGSPTGSGTYTIADNDETYVNDTAYNALTAINVTQNYAEFITGNLADIFYTTGDVFTITATVTLTYLSEADILTQFPGQGPTAPDNGVTISCSSNLAFAVDAVTASKNTLSLDESPVKIYYSEADPEIAILDLNPVGDKVGDFTPLGVNGLTLGESDTSANFDVLAVLDVTSVYDQISEYEDAYIKITLQQKGNDGTYGSDLTLNQYINSLTLEGMPNNTAVNNGTYYSIEVPKASMTDNGAEIAIPMLHFNIKTKSDFEEGSLIYGNYRISVNIVLRDENETEFIVSRVSNYVIYTNAKVVPYYIY